MKKDKVKSNSQEISEQLSNRIRKKTVDLLRVGTSRLAKKEGFQPSQVFCMSIIQMFEMTRMVDEDLSIELFGNIIHNLHKRGVLFKRLDISKDITDMLRHDKDDHVCKSCESELFEEVISETKH